MAIRSGHLHIGIAAPAPDDLQGPITVTVWCAHGRTSLHWRRTCGNGCHKGPRRAATCRRVNPTREQLEHLGVLGHGQRLGCGCDEPFWLTEGPEHRHVGGGLPGIQEAERMLSWEERMELGSSMVGGPPVWTE
jgi:hypothetical protein